MAVLKVTNAAVAFLLEIALLASFVVWGLALDAAWVVRVAVAALAPAAVALLWGLVLAPTSARRLRMPWIVLVKAALYGLAALALTHADHPGWAVALFGSAVASLVLAVAAGRDRHARWDRLGPWQPHVGRPYRARPASSSQPRRTCR